MDVYTFNDPKMYKVIERTVCKKHNADIGDACWPIIAHDSDILSAVCNTRAKKAGFVGQIKASSLNAKKPKKTFKKN